MDGRAWGRLLESCWDVLMEFWSSASVLGLQGLSQTLFTLHPVILAHGTVCVCVFVSDGVHCSLCGCYPEWVFINYHNYCKTPHTHTNIHPHQRSSQRFEPGIRPTLEGRQLDGEGKGFVILIVGKGEAENAEWNKKRGKTQALTARICSPCWNNSLQWSKLITLLGLLSL